MHTMWQLSPHKHYTHSQNGNWEREHKMHILLMVRHCDIYIEVSQKLDFRYLLPQFLPRKDN